MSIAIVIGATGLVGKCLVRQLLLDPHYSQVIALTRRTTGVHHDKYREHVIDFGKPESYAELLRGDVLFSALGTTRARAGSTVAQRTVDYTYQFEVAKRAAQQGVPKYVLVSSRNANPSSLSAYLKMKGELERDAQSLEFSSLHILQPGPLSGEREQPRLGEAVAETVLGALNAVGLFRSLRPISGEQVALAMRSVAKLTGRATHGPEQLFRLGA